MANEITIDFGALNLNNTNNITIGKIQQRENKDLKIYKIPRIDGSIASEGKRGALLIPIQGDIAGSDYDNLRTNIDTLKAGLHNGLQKLTLDDDRYVMAQLKSFNIDRIIMRTLAKWKAQFVAHYPFWLAESASSSDTTPSTGVGYNVTNSGNAPTRVKIVATAGGSEIDDDLQIENITRGDLLKYRGVLAATKILEIDNRYDTDDFEVLNDGSDDHVNFEGDFLILNPGVNEIEVTCANMPNVVLSWRNAWY